MKKTTITARAIAAFFTVLMCAITLSSCSQIKDFLRKKADITFSANGGTITAAYMAKARKEDKTGESVSPENIKLRCFVGDDLPLDAADRKYYKLEGWYTKEEGGDKVETVPEEDMTVYAHWKSANRERAVSITDLRTDRKDDLVRISRDEAQNVIDISFTLSVWFGQDIAFVDGEGNVLQKIEIPVNEDEFTTDGFRVSAEIPDRKWMDRKTSTYYIKSFANEHVDESDAAELRITLDGQCEYFNKVIEGSMVWYGGDAEAPDDRAGTVLATDDVFVYAERDGKVYTWEKNRTMINLPDVRTDPVYDIYNTYSSRFYPIAGKAMYMDNGGKGLSRYAAVDKSSAMHENKKTGLTTFMVPVQWDFAETVAKAQSKARDAGYTLYIADTFRPAAAVDPVAKAVDDASLLAYGGTSAHNFGMAVDTGWQAVDPDGNPTGEPFVRNLQTLKKKPAVNGPHGNAREPWWDGVNKLPQEWWHYGDSVLKEEYRDEAARVKALYVNQGGCLSQRRSEMNGK